MKLNFKSVAAIFVMTLFTACQSSGNQTTGTSGSGNETGKTGISEPKTDTIIISQMKFTPDNLTVNKGDTIIWINKDLVAHNVTEDPQGSVKSDTINVGKSWKLIPDHSFHYICSIHPTMKAEITVK